MNKKLKAPAPANAYTPFETLLIAKIVARIRELRQEGTTGMTLDNLRQVVRPPAYAVGAPMGTNAPRMYREIFNWVALGTPAIRKFLI